MANPYDFGPQYGGSLESYIRRLQKTKGPSQIFRGIAPGLGAEIGTFNAMAPMRMGALYNAYNALDPSNYGAITSSYADSAYGRAADIGRRMQNSLMGTVGNQPGVLAGAGLSALNQANNAIGQFRSSLYNPMNLANAYKTQADLYSFGNTVSAFPSALQALGIKLQNDAQSQSGGLLDTFVGLAGTAGGLGWSPFG